MNMQNWWYVTSNNQRLWRHAALGWQYHTKIPHCSQTARFHPHAHSSNAGPDLAKCSCVTTISSYQHILVQSGASITQPLRELEGLSSWETFQHSHFACIWKLEVEEVGEAQAIVKAIEDGTMIAVSDGSFKNGKDAAAWTIQGSLANNKITAAVLVPGIDYDHSTFQSKLMGLLGILLTAHYLLVDQEGMQGSLQV